MIGIPKMQLCTSLFFLLAIVLAGLISSTSSVGVADAATITLEPWNRNPGDFTFSITSIINVVNNPTNGRYDDAFPIDLYSSDTIEFVLKPPPRANEMRLSSSTPGEAIEVIFRASLVEGPNMEKCQNSVATTTKEKDDIFNDILFGDFSQPTVVGRDADILSQAFAWDRSYVSIEKYGCVVESRLFFQPAEDDGVIQTTIEKISWSAQYEVASIGDVADKSVSLYELSNIGLMVRGGDVSFHIVADKEKKMSREGMDTKGDMYPSVSLASLLSNTPRAKTIGGDVLFDIDESPKGSMDPMDPPTENGMISGGQHNTSIWSFGLSVLMLLLALLSFF